MEDPNAAARRLLVGVFAAILITTAVLLWILPGASTSQATVMWRGACGRVGIVVAALWESGEHGALAAPIVRDVIKAYFDKKARQNQLKPQQVAWFHR